MSTNRKTALMAGGPDRTTRGLLLTHERFGFYVVGAYQPCPYELPASINLAGVGQVRIERPLTEAEERAYRDWAPENLDDLSAAATYLYRASAD